MAGLTDVPGVRVAHVTLGDGARTGVTCVLPHSRDLLADPVTAAVHVVNGYGKPVGLAQVAELGEIETPVVLTNTLGVGAAHEGIVRHLLARHPDLGRPTTVNPVVLECNDGRLNDLRALAVRPEHVLEAVRLAEARPDGHEVEEGAVGAGHGMVAFGWKGGIGTASAPVDDRVWRATLGALVLTNMGRPEDLVVRGVAVDARPPGGGVGGERDSGEGGGRDIPGGGERDSGEGGGQDIGGGNGDGEGAQGLAADPVDGSVIVLLATDAPLDSRQLGRLARRAQNGLARTGVPTAHGSGEFVLAWTTARPEHRRDGDWLRPWFAAVADVVEEAVLSSMRAARTTVGCDGSVVHRCPVL
ncbi:P1 family peptidase [Ornithinimicrobium tianjinense]|uniref:D-aminopeptidase n=1 Tax=Ornithinimicrobium tianjinense TaxID=1195761 RepID=A0A917BQ82_9MICO|nr:P1 family peptidase [Ornithinimicrobium tianjinense]GGF54980.1 D-aminopeptidase [Ornithinimicrobium tianjinense]